MADAFWTSRHIAEPACLEVIFHFAQKIVELAGCDVTLHLLVPFVVVPTVQPRRQLGALFERELFDCSLNFGQTHVGDVTTARFLFQVPVIQSGKCR